MSSPFVVELPAEMRPLLEAEARAHGFGSVSDYLEALVRSNAAIEAEDPKLEAALRDGLGSGEVREADDAFWGDLGRRAREAAKKPRA
jgi:Arc/MetJ-type ribon-helix-helix transcriptional regulator